MRRTIAGSLLLLFLFLLFSCFHDMTVSALIDGGVVAGMEGEEISPSSVKITLTEDIFSRPFIKGEDVSGWFANIPDGLRAVIDRNIDAQSQSVTVNICGVTGEVVDASMEIHIPGEFLGGGKDMVIDPNENVRWKIIKNQNIDVKVHLVNKKGDGYADAVTVSVMPGATLDDVREAVIKEKVPATGLFAKGGGELENAVVTGFAAKDVIPIFKKSVMVSVEKADSADVVVDGGEYWAIYENKEIKFYFAASDGNGYDETPVRVAVAGSVSTLADAMVSVPKSRIPDAGLFADGCELNGALVAGYVKRNFRQPEFSKDYMSDTVPESDCAEIEDGNEYYALYSTETAVFYFANEAGDAYGEGNVIAVTDGMTLGKMLQNPVVKSGLAAAGEGLFLKSGELENAKVVGFAKNPQGIEFSKPCMDGFAAADMSEIVAGGDRFYILYRNSVVKLHFAAASGDGYDVAKNVALDCDAVVSDIMNVVSVIPSDGLFAEGNEFVDSKIIGFSKEEPGFCRKSMLEAVCEDAAETVVDGDDYYAVYENKVAEFYLANCEGGGYDVPFYVSLARKRKVGELEFENRPENGKFATGGELTSAVLSGFAKADEAPEFSKAGMSGLDSAGTDDYVTEGRYYALYENTAAAFVLAGEDGYAEPYYVSFEDGQTIGDLLGSDFAELVGKPVVSGLGGLENASFAGFSADGDLMQDFTREAMYAASPLEESDILQDGTVYYAIYRNKIARFCFPVWDGYSYVYDITEPVEVALGYESTILDVYDMPEIKARLEKRFNGRRFSGFTNGDLTSLTDTEMSGMESLADSVAIADGGTYFALYNEKVQEDEQQ